VIASLTIGPAQGQAQSQSEPQPIATAPAQTAQTSSAPAKDVEIQVGIVQRFGTRPTDKLVIMAPPGDRLTVTLPQGSQQKMLVATEVKLEVVMQPLPKPKIEERVVFGTYRSFESAEDTANRWQAEGIAVELAQPQRWQVWADRQTYDTPLLRRLLLQSLASQGAEAHLDRRVVQQRAQAAIVVNGYRFNRDQMTVTAGSKVIRVVERTGESSDRVYSGSLHLQPNAYSTYTLVNRVMLEQYLRGVVPHEIGPSAPPSAVAAQTILARTYALRNLRRFKIDDYELCADTQCQVYWGLGGATARSDQAIAATRGQVLTYNDELVDAVYSSTTGGITAPFNDVWNGPSRPYLQAVVDSVRGVWDLSVRPLSDEANFRAFIRLTQGFNEAGWDRFRWRKPSMLADMNDFLERYLVSINSPHAGFRTITKLQITERSRAGRVQRIRVTTDKSTFELEKDNILSAFYEPISLLFYIDPIYGADQTLKGYTFVGGGFGHGVGMSQTGSYYLAELGWSADRILRFYYPGTRLQPISEKLVFWRDPEAGNNTPETTRHPD